MINYQEKKVKHVKMTKTLRDVASVLYDVEYSVSCKICVKCKIYKCNERLSCLDCIEDGLEVLINKLTPKKPKITILNKEYGSYQCDCPTCGRFISVNCKDVTTVYCPECMQKFDWSDSK